MLDRRPIGGTYRKLESAAWQQASDVLVKTGVPLLSLAVV